VIVIECEGEFKVKSARDALALLSRRVYERFGADVLPLIEEVCYQLGRSMGEEIKKELLSYDLKTVATAFAEGAKRRKNPVDILELTDQRFHLKAYRCNLGLKGTSRELCWALMAMDRGIFEAATGKEIDLKIIKTLAVNDDRCEMIYRLKKE